MHDDFSAARAQYLAAQRWTYFDVSARGLLSVGVRAAIDGYLDHIQENGGDKEWMFAVVERTRERFAALIGAQADEVAIIKNVSEGINAFATAMPWQAGDNVVICQSLEHPANIFPWENLARMRGIGVNVVEPRAGRIVLDEIRKSIDERTRLVTVSTISFAPGFMFDMRELSQICRRRGILLMVDAAQSVGIVHTDVDEMGIDALSVSTQKGLLALYGYGFLYVRRAVAEGLTPVYLSRPGVLLSNSHEASAGDADGYRLATAARRFDVGNYNYIGAVAVDKSIEEIARLGTRAIEARVCALSRRLAEKLFEIGIPVFGEPDSPDRRHIVTIGGSISDHHDATDDRFLKALHDRLTEAKIRHTIRRGMLRLSLHLYNNEDDVDHAVAVAKAFLTAGSKNATLKAVNV